MNHQPRQKIAGMEANTPTSASSNHAYSCWSASFAAWNSLGSRTNSW
jgi:hypothetical protein